MAEETPQLVTFVCTANICRSPMAEKLLEHALAAEPPPLCDLEVVSTGVAGWEGNSASVQAVKAMEKVGLDLTGHRSQPLTKEIIQNSLAVFCMTEAHRAGIRQMYPDNDDTPVHLVREFLPPPAEKEIPDPFCATVQVYEVCRDNIVEAIPSIVQYLKELTGKNP